MNRSQKGSTGRSPFGKPRHLTDAQVKRVLAWADSRKTLRQLAREEGVALSTVINCLARKGRYVRPSPDRKRRVHVCGQPRKLTDKQVRRILRWQRSRKTIAQVAWEEGVSTSVIESCIQFRGIYKSVSPERRVALLEARRKRYRQMQASCLI